MLHFVITKMLAYQPVNEESKDSADITASTERFHPSVIILLQLQLS